MTKDAQVRNVTESVAASHPEVPTEEIEEMAEEALARTADARVQGHRVPLAENDVTSRILAERHRRS